jgi:hypothetical protein
MRPDGSTHWNANRRRRGLETRRPGTGLRAGYRNRTVAVDALAGTGVILG